MKRHLGIWISFISFLYLNWRTVVYSEEARSVQTNDDVDLTCTTLCHLDEAVGPVEVLPNTMYVHEWYCY